MEKYVFSSLTRGLGSLLTRMLRHVLPLLACCFTLHSVLAADVSPAPLPTINLAGGKAAATVTVGMSADGGASYVDAVEVGTSVDITATIKVDPAHVGEVADVFVVQRLGNSFTVKNQDGAFVTWDLKVSGLVPHLEGITLGDEVELDVFSGAANTPGALRLFIAYLPAGGSGLIFNPTAARFDILEEAVVELSALEYFEDNIARNVLIRCVVCHAKGGVADGHTTLLYERDPSLTQENFDIFANFFDARGNDAVDYILSKASGGDSHTGGNQLPAGSSNYQAMETFLSLLGGSSAVASGGDSSDFFSGVIFQDRSKTLRRAAILLAGRLPTAAEERAVANGNDNDLRRTLKGLMDGDVFHEWLKDAANDRLLVRGTRDFLLDECFQCWLGYVEKRFELQQKAVESGSPLDQFDFQQYTNQVNWSLKESPLELIAWVVERELPYTEILTARYDMFNPVSNQAVVGTARFPDNADLRTFRPGRMEGYYRQGESVVTEQLPFIDTPKMIDPGDLQTNYPHAGVLNSKAFLARYPTTATNRNRARARWTFYHFLGFDIEASAQRTTDPDALADTNNPTMNNPNCIICHARMDPVAGAFQNYGLAGRYREGWEGLDSLDNFYKYPEGVRWEDRLYQEGDTWYRDMREPGIADQKAPNDDRSLQWLADQLVADPRFPVAAVKFWWPAVFGEELLPLPEVESDPDYRAKLAAFDAQTRTISELADSLATGGYILKDMLVEMLMTEWFRADAIDPEVVTPLMDEAHIIAGLGNEKLLTPEQLSRKTEAITGFSWNRNWDAQLEQKRPGLEQESNSLYYGGIDSANVTKRSAQMTPLMNNVAMRHALESSCSIVVQEFIKSDSQRNLFSGIDEFMTPLLEDSASANIRSIDADDYHESTNQSEEFTVKTFDLTLTEGPKKLKVDLLNGYCDWDPETEECLSDAHVIIDKITITRKGSAAITTLDANTETPGFEGGNNCAWPWGDSVVSLHGTCFMSLEYNAPSSGGYEVKLHIAALKYGAPHANTQSLDVNFNVESNVDPRDSVANGALAIKDKLVDLYDKMLGIKTDRDSPEISQLYAFWVESWEERNTWDTWPSLGNENEMCMMGNDTDFFEGLGFPGVAQELYIDPDSGWRWYQTTQEAWDWIWPMTTDPGWTKSAWKDVMTYMMTHYNYLYE